MNKEEIVNNSVKHCCICNNKKYGEFISINDEKYHLCCIEQLQQENKQLKELISAILNWNIFKNECPMSLGYDENTIEDKAQEVFYENDDYCENNCNDDYKKCWLKYFRKMQELEKGDKQ